MQDLLSGIMSLVPFCLHCLMVVWLLRLVVLSEVAVHLAEAEGILVEGEDHLDHPEKMGSVSGGEGAQEGASGREWGWGRVYRAESGGEVSEFPRVLQEVGDVALEEVLEGVAEADIKQHNAK
jgi:hypothetical protein